MAIYILFLWIAKIPRSARNLNDGIVWIAALVSLARNDKYKRGFKVAQMRYEFNQNPLQYQRQMPNQNAKSQIKAKATKAKRDRINAKVANKHNKKDKK